MRLNFVSLSVRNFMSIGNDPMDYVFDGTNKLFMGSNGSGKSTLTDALCFGLYGRAYRSVTKGQLVNSINGKETEVHVSFMKGQKHYLVHRGIKPDVLEIFEDSILIEPPKNVRDYQDYLETEILGMSFPAFIQIVILGSARYTPFMSLSASARRLVIDDVLSLSQITTMFDRTKELYRANDRELELVQTRHKHVKDLKEQVEQTIRKFKEIDKVSEEDFEEGRAKIMETIRAKKFELDALSVQSGLMEDFTVIPESLGEVRKHRTRLVAMKAGLSERLKKAKEGILFFGEHSVCPTCEQDVEETFRDAKVMSYMETVESIERAFVQIDGKMEDLSKEETRLANGLAQKEARDRKIADLKAYVASMKTELSRRKTSSTPASDITEFLQKRDTYDREISDLLAEEGRLVVRRECLRIVRNNLDEKALKADIISTYIPQINARISHYLDLLGFNVDFVLDETFKETIHSRGRDKFSYESFSEGQKRRIDLALLFTWRDIANMKHSVSTNLLIMDEVFDSSLDADGIESVTNLMDDVGKDTSIIVISHGSDELQTRFDHVYRVSMPYDFTVIEEIS